MSEPEAAAPIDPAVRLRQLQAASIASGGGESLPGFENNAEATIKAHLAKEGYNLNGNSVDVALRAWQHRHGLSASGLGADGKPDLVTQAMLAQEMGSKKPLGLEYAQMETLDNLTRLANGVGGKTYGADKLFELTQPVATSDAAPAAPVAATAEAAAPAAAVPVVATPVAAATAAEAAEPELDAMGNPIIKAVAGAPAAHDHGHAHEHDHAAHAGDPLGDFIREKDKPTAATTGPDLGKSVSEGLDTARAAGGKLMDSAAETGGKVWDSVTGAFKDLGRRLESATAPAAEDPAAKAEAARLQAEREAEAKAKLQAAADAITKRAGELRRDAGEVTTGAMDKLGEGLRGLGDRIKKLGSDEPAAPVAPAADAAPAAASPPPPKAKVLPKF